MNRRAINLPPAVLWLAVVLIAIHLLRHLLSAQQDETFILTFAFIPQRYTALGMTFPGGTAARYWSPLTYAFLHAGYVHLIVNLVWMASFGAALARRFGSARFLALAAAGALAGALAHCIMHPADPGIVVGASAAISGMMAATARFAFSPGGPLAGGVTDAAYLVPAESMLAAVQNPRAVTFILIWFAVNLVFGVTGGLGAGVAGTIAWEAHIGGFLAGLVGFSLLDPVRLSRPVAD